MLGEATTYSFDRITRAIRFVNAGARFIATNPDVMGPGEGESSRRPVPSLP